MRVRLFQSVACMAVLLTALPVMAHHAFSAEFERDKPVTFKGTVVKMAWTNPHSWLYVAVKGPDGQVEEWAFEGSAPNAMIRAGWNRESIKPGTEVIVSGYRAKDGGLRANLREVTLADGKKLFSGSQEAGGPEESKEK